MSRKSLVMGIDGGGTKTHGFLADEYGNVLTRRSVGPTNPNVSGVDHVAKTLVKLIHECCDDGRCRVDELKAVVLGLAGAGVDQTRKKVRHAIDALLEKEGSKPPAMVLETDARIALEGAFAGGPGVVIIAGTGSVVIGKTQRNEILTVGGWGRTLGDEGSGYHIGREAIRAVTLLHDKRGEKTMLGELFAQKLKWKSREDIIVAVYQEKFDLASLAPLVVEAARDHDLVAQRLLQQEATQLAEQARIIVLQMGILRKVGLVMSGGLLEHESLYANVLHMKLLKLLPQVDVRPPIHPPVHGAVLMALERLKRM